jgi:hypothetical protein
MPAMGDRAFTSIVEGSSLTGAPGQPVGVSGSPEDGKLRDSFELALPNPYEFTVLTDVGYAPDVEDNVRNVQFHNHGPHSVKRTISSFDRIVADAVGAVVK